MNKILKTCIFAALAFTFLGFSVGFAEDQPTDLNAEGSRLYEKFCSQCHSHLQNSEKAGRSFERIRSAMKRLHQDKPPAVLNDQQLSAIASVLKTVKF